MERESKEEVSRGKHQGIVGCSRAGLWRRAGRGWGGAGSACACVAGIHHQGVQVAPPPPPSEKGTGPPLPFHQNRVPV